MSAPDTHFADDAMLARIARLEAERDQLAAHLAVARDAMAKTIDDNGHLADGDNCTLIALKRALEKIGAGEAQMTAGELIAAFSADTAALPSQQEEPERGCCTYNWQMAALAKLRRMAAGNVGAGGTIKGESLK